MLSHTRINRFLSTITFSFIDFTQYTANSAEVSNLMKAKMRVIAEKTCHQLKAMSKTHTLEFKLNEGKYAFACTMSLEILTNIDLTADLHNNYARILEALKNSVQEVDPNQRFNFDFNANHLSIKSQPNPQPHARYNRNVARNSTSTTDEFKTTETKQVEFERDFTLSTSEIMTATNNNTYTVPNKSRTTSIDVYGFNPKAASSSIGLKQQPVNSPHLQTFSHFNDNNRLDKPENKTVHTQKRIMPRGK